MYSYVVTSYKPTTVLHSVVCHFTSPQDNNVIIAKGNVLEIQSYADNELRLEKEISLYGRVEALSSYRLSSGQDVLVIITNKHNFCVIGYDSVAQKVTTRSTGNFRNRIARAIETGLRVLVDRKHGVICASIFEGFLKIIQIDGQILKEPFDARYDILTYTDIVILNGCSRPTLCVIFKDSRHQCHLRTYNIDLREKELTAGPWSKNNLDPTAVKLIAVPEPINGVLLIGEAMISYLNGGSHAPPSVIMEATVITSFCQADVSGNRFFLTDTNGVLYVLLILLSDPGQPGSPIVRGLALDRVGLTCIASSLHALDRNTLFVGSNFGDSQLIRLIPPSEYQKASKNTSPRELDERGMVEVFQSFTNAGPILDMTVVQSDRRGHSRVVTCSGVNRDGTLRVISSGVGIQEQALLEMPGIRGLWSLVGENKADKFLVIGFTGETRVLGINEGNELAELEFPGLAGHQTSLYAGRTNYGDYIQVTTSSIRLIDGSTLTLLSEYLQSHTIVASSTGSLLMTAISGGTVGLWQVGQSRDLLQLNCIHLEYDVSCIGLSKIGSSNSSSNLNSMNVDLTFDTDQAVESQLAALGVWTENTVRVYSLPSFAEVARAVLGVESPARDVLISNLDSGSHLFVALGDGALVYYKLNRKVENDTHGWFLDNRKKVVLGTRQITLTPFTSATTDAPCVFATGDVPSIIYAQGGKTLFSPVNLNAQEVTHMVPFHSPLVPHGLALSSENCLMIGTVDDIQKKHIQTHPLGSTPRRIAYLQSSNVFVVALEALVAGGHLNVQLHFLEEDTFNQLLVWDLDPVEQCLALHTCRLDISEANPIGIEYVVVGTAYVIPNDTETNGEPSRGRLLVFEVTAGVDRPQVTLVAEKELRGAVFTLSDIAGKIVAAVNHKLQVYKIKSGTTVGGTNSGTSSTPSNFNYPELQLDCTIAGHIMCLYVRCRGDFIITGDLIRSITVFRYRAAQEAGEKSSVEEVARDMHVSFTRSIEFLGTTDDVFLGCDSDGNLFALRRQPEASTDEERGKLESVGYFHLADVVNVIKRGTLSTQPDESYSSDDRDMVVDGSLVSTDAHMKSKSDVDRAGTLLLGTVSGALISVLSLTQEAFLFFSTLERAMKTIVAGVGGMSHESYREYLTERRQQQQLRMIDGDLIEHLLDLCPNDLRDVVRQVNDEIAGNAQSSAPNVMKSSNSASQSVFVSSGRDTFTEAEIIRRVEDISRLH